MAVVYLAQDLRHDRPVALKVLLPELAATLGPERFQREIKLAARAHHPHLPTGTAARPRPPPGPTPPPPGRSTTRARPPVACGSRCRSSRAKACATGSA